MTTNSDRLIVIFGATGDLTRLKLLPAIRKLWITGKISSSFKVIAVGRRDYTTADYINYLSKQKSHPFDQDMSMVGLEYIQVDLEQPGGMNPLLERLLDFKESDMLMYMALAPEVLHNALDRFEEPESLRLPANTHISIVAEKPIGNSLQDAKELSKKMVSIFRPQHVFRNDHYLKKDTIQSILPIRKSDKRLSSLLTKDNLLEAQIIVTEKVDLGSRAGYFDCRGMVVDWIQSHMLQILAITFADVDTDNFAMSKAEFIRSLGIDNDSIIRAQYNGYNDVEGINPDCQTDTFLALHLHSSIPKWQGVTFSLIAGKALAKKTVEILLKLRKPHPRLGQQVELHLDPPGGHKLLSKLSGDEFEETILDAFNGKQDSFVSQAEVEAQWELTEKIQKQIQITPLQSYDKGISYSDFCVGKWCKYH